MTRYLEERRASNQKAKFQEGSYMYILKLSVIKSRVMLEREAGAKILEKPGGVDCKIIQ